MKTHAAAFLLFQLILSSCSPSLRGPANIFTKDDRETFERIDYPQWGSLHQRPIREKPWGTAFIISRCHIGSAYHVVKPTQLEIKGTETVYFDTPLRDKMVAAKPVKWGKAWQSTKQSLDSEDWVILKLNECFLEGEVEPLLLKKISRELLINRPLMLAGFPEDRITKNITVDRDCKTGPNVFKKDLGIGHNCATRPGNSGGPLINNQNEVIAIAVASRGYFDEIIVGYSDWISNKACPIGPMADALEDILE